MGYLLASSGGGAGGVALIYVAGYALGTLPIWGVLKKAGPNGAPAWAGFVPVYNVMIVLKMVGRPQKYAWFLLLYLIPVLGWIALVVLSIIVLNDVSKAFGHGSWFTVGLVLLSVIFWYVLWLGSSQYRGPAVTKGFGGSYGPEPEYPRQPGYPHPPSHVPPPPVYPPIGQAPPPPPAYPPPTFPPDGPPPPPGQVSPPQ